MSKSDALTAKRRAGEEQNTRHADDQVDADFEVEFELDGEPEKSETEEELERLVFGDSAGFRRSLKDSALEQANWEESADEETVLEGLDDADVGLALSDSKVIVLSC